MPKAPFVVILRRASCFAAVGLATALVATGCSTSDGTKGAKGTARTTASDEVPAEMVNVQFRFISWAGAGSSHRQRTQRVEMSIEHKRQHVVALASVVLNDDGSLESRSEWRQGWEKARVKSQPYCNEVDVPPPTKPELDDILSDTYGPTKDFALAGYRMEKPGVYVTVQGGYVFQIIPGRSLAEREFEVIDPRDKQPISRIDQIALGGASKTAQSESIPCNPRSKYGTRTLRPSPSA